MTLTINGETYRSESDILTLEALLAEKNIPSAGTAVAVNGRIVQRKDHPVHELHDGDAVIIITAAYGG